MTPIFDRHTCLVCSKPITWQFAICSACEAEYGNKMEQWPEWLSYLWKDTQRQRRASKRSSQFELPLESADMYQTNAVKTQRPAD